MAAQDGGHAPLSLEDTIALAVRNSIGSLKEELLREIRQPNKRELASEVSDTVAKKLKESSIPELRRSYNKDQFKHNNKVKQALLSVEEALEGGDVDKAKDEVSEGKRIIDKRQKLIKLADREDDGWEVAKCYLSDNLAENSDDEKRQIGRRLRRFTFISPISNKTETLTLVKIDIIVIDILDLTRVIILTKMFLGIIFLTILELPASCVEREDILLLPAQKTEHLNLEIRNFEFERNEPVNSVVGRLRKNILFWKKDLLASNFVLSIIEFGYYMPFLEHPPLCHTKNNKSSLKHPGFIEQAINALLEKGCIIELEDRPYCCNPLTVAERPKLRLVIDLRHVNKYIKTTKFRYEDLSTLSEMFKEGDYFTKFDLTSGYHHIDIHPEHWKYLGFEWLFSNGQTRFFHFVVLPFGLSPACYVFTKVLRPLVKKWRSSGIRSILYIDDGINGSNSYKSALISAKAV